MSTSVLSMDTGSGTRNTYLSSEQRCPEHFTAATIPHHHRRILLGLWYFCMLWRKKQWYKSTMWLFGDFNAYL